MNRIVRLASVPPLQYSRFVPKVISHVRNLAFTCKRSFSGPAQPEQQSGKLSLDPAQAVLIAALITLLGVTSQIPWSRPKAAGQLDELLLQERTQADTLRQFERRRIDAIKARLLSPPLAGSSLVQPFPRPDALRDLERLSTKKGIFMVVGPRGEGKSTLVSQFVATHPHVIYVDLRGGFMDTAVRAVAAALGYDMTDSAEEALARQQGLLLPDLQSAQTTRMYETLLNAFEHACTELQSEGRLVPGCAPVLVLDHANCPLQPSTGPSPTPAAAALLASADTNLMFLTVQLGHYVANKQVASLVMVCSDLLQEMDAWQRASGRDSVGYIRAPPFSHTDAVCLLSRLIFASRTGAGSSTALPTPEDLDAVQRDYSSTISTIISTLGTRARWLVQALQRCAHAPLTDAQLGTQGVPIPAAYLPYLPAELHSSSLRVDPRVWVALQAIIEGRKASVGAFLNVSSTLTLAPAVPGAVQGTTAAAEHTLAVHAALQSLLLEPLPRTALEQSFFASEPQLLRKLSQQHVVFYNHDTTYVEVESELMRRVLAAQLASQDRQLSMQLLRLLLALQAAAQSQAALEQQVAVDSRSAGTWFKPDRAVQLEHRLDAARAAAEMARLAVEVTRASLAEATRASLHSLRLTQ